MTQIHVDPDRLLAFANQLLGVAQHADGCMGQLRGRMARLHETWKDEQYEQFAAEFALTQVLVKRFVESTGKIVPSLRRDAAVIREFQRY